MVMMLMKEPGSPLAHRGGTGSRAVWRCPRASAVGLGAGPLMKSITLEKKRPSWAQLLLQASLSLTHTEEKGLRPDGRKDWVLGLTRCSSSPSHIFTACRRFPLVGSGSPICLCSQPWHGAMELESPQNISSLIIIFLQVKQDPFQLPLGQQRPPAVPSLVFLWTSAPQQSPQLGGLGWEPVGKGSRRRKVPLSTASVLQLHHRAAPWHELLIKGSKQVFCCPNSRLFDVGYAPG